MWESVRRLLERLRGVPDGQVREAVARAAAVTGELDGATGAVPADQRRLIFVRQLDVQCVIDQVTAYDLHRIEGRPELTVFSLDQGFVAVACPSVLPAWHFLNLVSWLTDAVGDAPLRHRFDGAIGVSDCPSDPSLDFAVQTDPAGDGSMLLGVDASGTWWRYELPGAVRHDAGTALVTVDGPTAHLAFLEARFVPRRLWDDPGAERYLHVAARVRVGS
jgi:hypothetical protein